MQALTEARKIPKPSFPYGSPGELNSFLPYLLTRITHIWSSELNQALASEKLPTPKLRLLSSLSAYGELTVGQLATLGVMEQSTTSRTVDQLVDEGLAARSISDADQRKRTVVLTRKGKKKLAEISPLINDFHAELVGNVDPDKLQTCIEVLGEILKGKTDY
ncbi:MarR family winged helix-turn-helix transcriptional regulator [Ruegeria pomeroyi]|uniref:Winged helix-turn-helix transcriptional regulator n=1 Tax=Ruegeria pomeroyi TaxID=89184 RepID=A0A850LKP6_9RHOB|nr:MarR family winged helix-turn-helix transcriptional regulator [Ruegeria pomeroyi]NVK98132.1 winged helix-turn-helix transcriptional regulator [Ruegeria pomeroyi]